LKIAVEGCGHGQLDMIYDSLEKACSTRGWTLADLDFLIICGDFQATRNEQDLNCMSVPKRYRKMGDFHKYYSGEKTAPVLTLVIGGNHEASNYFSELYYGGWLAPNMYYLGDANVIRYGPFRIMGMSGIYKKSDYGRPHFERLPYVHNSVVKDINTVYHVRECDVLKLLRVCSPVDIGLSHDWPRRVEWFGDYQNLFEERPHFYESAKRDNLGSAPAEKVMDRLRPTHWFSGHMHIRFTAAVEHKGHAHGEKLKDLKIPREVRDQLPDTMFRSVNASKETKKALKFPAPDITNNVTHFLALDKPGPNSEFLELLQVDWTGKAPDASTSPYMEKTSSGKFALHYDEEWLSILRSSDRDPSLEDLNLEEASMDADPHLSWIQTHITSKGLLKIPSNFSRHAKTHIPGILNPLEQPKSYPNAQTETFCTMLDLPN
ncbi:hypothetical protein BS50DRAFT_466231, partial [Corynespora cassiicola Philippines]